MKLKRILFSIILLSISVLSFGQNETSKTTEINLVPHWKKEEVHSVVIKYTTTDYLNQKPITSYTTYNANFKVLEKTETEYIVEWIYTNSKVAANDPNIENKIIGNLLNTKFQIKLSPFGKFIELVNVEEIRAATNKTIQKLLDKETNPKIKVQYNGVKQLIISKQGLDIALLKQIKLYHFSFGYKYKLDFEQINNIKFPNSFGGEPYNAVEKVKLVAVNYKDSICKIQTSKIVDGTELPKSVIDLLKRIDKEHIKKIEQDIGNKSFELTENSMQELNFEKGILKKSSFKRRLNLGIQNRTVLMEMEAID